MKIALVHGHMRRGSTYNISHILLDNIPGEKTVNEIFVPDVVKNGCLGCYKCIDDDSKCPFYEEKMKIMNVILDADLIIFTTPTYCMAPAAQLKMFIDLTFTYWMSHRPREVMFNKRAVVISTCAGTGSNKAIEPVARTLFYWGIPKVYKYGKSVQASSFDEIPEKIKNSIKEDMATLGKKLNTSNKPSVGIKTRFMFGIMRMMQNSNMGSGELEKEYWASKGWLGNSRPWKK